MPVPQIVQYPLDLSAVSPTNRIEGEVRDITTDNARVFVPMAGPFYAESFTIINRETGEPLRPVDDYVLCQPFAQAALRSGRDVQSAVALKVSAPIQIEMGYQVVGGEYSWNLQALIDLIAELDLDDRPIKWGSILGRPTAYPPAPHIHDIGDTFGWEYVVWQLERIAQAIMVGDEASHDELRQQIQTVRDQLLEEITNLDARFVAHINDHDNPHQVTKAQTGLGNVDNFATASDLEALAGTVNNRFMTPSLTSLLATRIAEEEVSAHEAKKNNPHEVTKAQVGLGLVDNFATATKTQAEDGTVNDRFMTPLRTKEAIVAQVGTKFDAHVNNKLNPHGVTKAQTGLGNVDNFATATQEQAVSNAVNDRFMTPLRTYEAIMAHVGDTFNSHVSNLSNPHQVTADQVGAYAIAQTDNLLDQKLDKTATAVNSNQLDGSSKAQVLAEAYAAVGTMGKRNVFISTSDPTASAGAIGDIWLKY